MLPGSPADKEHLADGDIIESIGEQSTRELSLAVIRLLLEGKPGSTLTISVVRPRKADPDKITLTRSVTAPASIAEQQYENSTILYLKPGALTAGPRGRDRSQAQGRRKGRKVLLDLRDSSGDDLSRVCAWPTSSSSREPWRRSKARSFPARLSPPIRPNS